MGTLSFYDLFFLHTWTVKDLFLLGKIYERII